MPDYHSFEFTKHFDKQYIKLTTKQKQAFVIRLAIFKLDPYDEILHNHGLKGKYKGHRSISIQGDLRALYTIKMGKIYLFGFIGTHSQLYGK